MNRTRYCAGNSRIALRGRRPQRRGHRHQVLVAKGRTVAVLRRDTRPSVGPAPGRSSSAGRFAIEAHADRAACPRSAATHRLRRWQNSVSRLVALYSSPLASLRTEKLMVVGCDSHAKLGEQPRQQRIVRCVVDDEAGVDRERLALALPRRAYACGRRDSRWPRTGSLRARATAATPLPGRRCRNRSPRCASGARLGQHVAGHGLQPVHQARAPPAAAARSR